MHEKEKRAHQKNVRPIVDKIMTGIGVIASLSSLPQVIKIWQTGIVAGISLTTYSISFTAVSAWFFYGLYIKNKPLIITSIISMCSIGFVIVQILHNTLRA